MFRSVMKLPPLARGGLIRSRADRICERLRRNTEPRTARDGEKIR